MNSIFFLVIGSHFAQKSTSQSVQPPSAFTHLLLWCCSGSRLWQERPPPRCYRKHSCCTTSWPSGPGLHSEKAAPLQGMIWCSSPPLSSDSPPSPFGRWGTQVSDLTVPKKMLVVQNKGLTLIWHWVIGEKPSCPGDHVRFSLLDCLSITLTSNTGLGRTMRHQRKYFIVTIVSLKAAIKGFSYLWC